ncbi:chemotaxis response regulator protein-glutamate methylesterase [Puniceicoccaceae bacterium K14]|nr:chemotaxis response regulator protein-glutamate methylesterase [Puniceicoccaceae bacterium K14]
MAKTRILIVDDSVVIRRMISKVIESDANMEVAGVAANGRIALQKISQINPDAITLDIEMPIMNGIETVKEIRKSHPKIPVIMFSTLSTQGAVATLEALAAGATDYVAKPANVGNVTEGIGTLKNDLLPKIKAHFRPKAIRPSPPTTNAGPTKPAKRTFTPQLSGKFPPAVFCIGSSTGGPNALSDLFGAIKNKLPVPTFIVQHMPPLFTKMLADRLDKSSPNRFYEAEDGQIANPGCVYIAPGGKHMEISKDGNKIKIHLHKGPPENSCRPAVDVLFRSVASVYGSSTLAAILTGMGSDGKRGCDVIKSKGGQIIAQDEESCVVWGMPRAIADNDLADEILPLDQIAPTILRRMGNQKIVA